MITVYLRQVANSSRVSMFYAKSFTRTAPKGYLMLTEVKDMDPVSILFIPEENIAYYIIEPEDGREGGH